MILSSAIHFPIMCEKHYAVNRLALTREKIPTPSQTSPTNLKSKSFSLSCFPFLRVAGRSSDRQGARAEGIGAGIARRKAMPRCQHLRPRLALFAQVVPGVRSGAPERGAFGDASPGSSPRRFGGLLSARNIRQTQCQCGEPFSRLPIHALSSHIRTYVRTPCNARAPMIITAYQTYTLTLRGLVNNTTSKKL